MKRSDAFSSLQSLLPGVVDRYQLHPQVKGAHVSHVMRDGLKEIFKEDLGEALDQYIRVESFREGWLSLIVLHPAFAEQVHLKETRLRDFFVKHFPDEALFKVRCRVDSAAFSA